MARRSKKRGFPTLNRRNFMQLSGGCATLSSTSLLSTLVNLKLTNTAIANGGDLNGYKSMVCIFLLGGVDSFNVLAPFEDNEYTDYSNARSNLALPKDQLLEVGTTSGRKFGVHPGMPEIRDLYNDNKLAFVANVGSLVEPTTLANYDNVKKPLGLYSHSDLIRHWQTSVPESRTQVTGWAGRMADMLNDTVNQHPAIGMNISLSGLNTFETGTSIVPYVVQSGGASALSGYGGTGTGLGGMYTRFTDNALSETYGDLLEKSYAGVRRQSIQAAIDFNSSTDAVELNTAFPDSGLGSRLKMIAQAIGARQSLQQSRQIFFVSIGGWDHHDNVIDNQAGMLPMVSQAMKAFYDATVELGVSNEVVTFTASDFGRTLSSNGNGSDHAWGGNQLVMGGGVAGGDVYGSYPTSLALGNNLDTGRGRLIPTTSVDEYNAELACWFGVQNNSDLQDVLPNIRNFYSETSSQPPVGFMGNASGGNRTGGAPGQGGGIGNPGDGELPGDGDSGLGGGNPF